MSARYVLMPEREPPPPARLICETLGEHATLMIRLFVALEIPDDIRGHLETLHAGVPGARWVASENIHLTLRFIGDVDGAVCEDVVDALLAIRAPSFELTLERLGTFQQGSIAHTLWVGVQRNEVLLQLQSKVERVLVAAGLPPERRRYAPHLTIARLRDASVGHVGSFIAEHEPFRMPPFAVEIGRASCRERV